MTANTTSDTHVKNLWDKTHASELKGVDRLVFRSNILGDDLRITNTGGGNTSSKLTEIDPLTGEEVTILWVKGSGGDLRTSKSENFAALYMDKVIGLQKTYNDQPDRRGFHRVCFRRGFGTSGRQRCFRPCPWN